MLPLKFTELVIRNDNELRFILRNVRVYGIENARVANMRIDFVGMHVEHNITIPRLNVVGDYEVTGRLVNQQVNGIGKANITIINGIYTEGHGYVVDPQFWVTMLTPYGFYRPQRVIYHFSNIISGNDFYGYQTNIYLNNNWREVSRAFRPGTSRIIADFVVTVYQGIANVTTFDEAVYP